MNRRYKMRKDDFLEILKDYLKNSFSQEENAAAPIPVTEYPPRVDGIVTAWLNLKPL